MRAVGLKTLKNKLAEYVRLAASGVTILITDRERVVAELIPPRSGRSPLASDALLADAVRQGWLTPSTLVGDEPPESRPTAPLAELLSQLDRGREER